VSQPSRSGKPVSSGPASGKREARAALALLLGVALAGCVAYPSVAPGRLAELEPSSGILVLHTQAPWEIERVELSDQVVARGLPSGTSLRLLILPAGRYRWSQIQLIDSGRRASHLLYRLTMLDDERWNLAIEPRRINYPGQLVVEPGANLGVTDRFAVRSLNRSAMMMELLGKLHPELSRRYPIVYTGAGRDEFLGRYQDALSARGAPGPAALQDEEPR
jgi:hypothetical protein